VGYGHVVLKSDQEPAILALKEAVTRAIIRVMGTLKMQSNKYKDSLGQSGYSYSPNIKQE